MVTETIKSIDLFYSYSQQDEELRNKLETHLSSLKRQGLISEWYDRKIGPGKVGAHEIDAHLKTAKIILLLVSPDFIASDYYYINEVEQALKRHENGDACVIPIILRPVDWESTPLGKLRALPTNAKPITRWSNRDEAFLDIAKEIRKVVENLTIPLLKNSEAIQTSMIWNVPYQRNLFFTGRQDIIELLHETFKTGKTGIVTQREAISGLGGIGKTQTAIEYAYQYRSNYQTILWIRADTHETLVSDFVSIANLLNLPEKYEQDQGKIVAAVHHWLKDHTAWLLIFDNADDLSIVRNFIPQIETGHILLTTRRQAMSGIAGRIDMDQMKPEDGALFLLRRAGIISLESSLDGASEIDMMKALHISQEMDGLPLALDQAGAYIEETGCSLTQYLNLYQTRGMELLQQRGISFDYPQSVATTWSLSFERLRVTNPAAIELLQQCSFLHPDEIAEEIIIEAVPYLSPVLQTIAANLLKWNDAVKEILKFSLMRRNPGTQIFIIHRLVQAVLRSDLDEETQHQWAERTVYIINHAFPDVDFTTWPRCQQCLPHAQICATFIKQWDMKFIEAARLLNHTSQFLCVHAQYSQAEPLCKQALEIYEGILGPEHLTVAQCLQTLARIYRGQGNFPQAEFFCRKALSIREHLMGDENLDVAESLHELAWLCIDQSKYTEVEELCKRALAIREKLLEPEHLEVAQSLNCLAWFYDDIAKYTLVEALYQRALAIREKALGLEHPDVAQSLNNLAWFYKTQGQYEQAESLYQRALTIRKLVLGAEHPDVASSLNNLARLYTTEGKYTDAEPLLKQALSIQEHRLGPQHTKTTQSLSNLAGLYAAQGRYADAEKLYKQALTIREQTLGMKHPKVATSLNDLAMLYSSQKMYNQAEPLLQEALAILENTLGLSHPGTKTVLKNYSQLLRELNRENDAADLEARTSM